LGDILGRGRMKESLSQTKMMTDKTEKDSDNSLKLAKENEELSSKKSFE
jgi:hypothetical protein